MLRCRYQRPPNKMSHCSCATEIPVSQRWAVSQLKNKVVINHKIGTKLSEIIFSSILRVYHLLSHIQNM